MTTPARPRTCMGPNYAKRNAKQAVDAMFIEDGVTKILGHCDKLRYWDEGCWGLPEEGEIIKMLGDYFDIATYTNDKDRNVVFPVNPLTMKKILDGIVVDYRESDSKQFNTWRAGTDQEVVEKYHARDMIPMANGLLHVPTRTLLDHTPTYFNQYVLPYDYRHGEEPCEKWLEFLDTVFKGDKESIECVQEMMGYILSTDTSQQKMFNLLGEKRSGKGTIVRVIERLVGYGNHAPSSLLSLNGDFGLASISSAQVITMGDLRIGRGLYTQAIERLLGITGEDELEVQVKNKRSYETRLPGRILISSNDPIVLSDTAGALNTRLIVIKTQDSFVGREDTTLFPTFAANLSGIFNWALDGLDRLHERGHFVQPSIALEIVAATEKQSSPLIQFAEDMCVVTPRGSVPDGEQDLNREAKNTLYNAYLKWSELEKQRNPLERHPFFMQIGTAIPWLKTGKTFGDSRQNAIVGISVDPEKMRYTQEQLDERAGLPTSWTRSI